MNMNKRLARIQKILWKLVVARGCEELRWEYDHPHYELHKQLEEEELRIMEFCGI